MRAGRVEGSLGGIIKAHGNDMFNDSTKGVAKVEWNHSHQCIKKYIVRLQYNNTMDEGIKGEIILDSPLSLKEKVAVNLHEIPGKIY